LASQQSQQPWAALCVYKTYQPYGSSNFLVIIVLPRAYGLLFGEVEQQINQTNDQAGG